MVSQNKIDILIQKSKIREFVDDCKVVVALSLQGLNIGNAGAIRLAAYLAENPQVRYVDASYNKIGDSGIHALTQTLQNQNELVSLDLCGNCISDSGAQFLADVFTYCEHLEEIDLSRNQIHSQGAIAIAQRLLKNQKLKTLVMYDNEIGPAGASAFFNLIKNNDILMKIDILANNIDDAIARDLLAKTLRSTAYKSEVSFKGYVPDMAEKKRATKEARQKSAERKRLLLQIKKKPIETEKRKPIDKTMIMSLRKHGMLLKDIAKIMNIGAATVSRAVKKYEQEQDATVSSGKHIDTKNTKHACNSNVQFATPMIIEWANIIKCKQLFIKKRSD